MGSPRGQHRVAIGSVVALIIVASGALALRAGSAPSTRVEDVSPSATERDSEPASSAAPSPSPLATAASAVQTFTAVDGSFEIRLPIVWRQTTGSDPSALYLVNGPMEMSLRAGDAEGSITTCDDPAGAWETCGTSTPGSLAELGDAIGLTSKDEWGMTPRGPARSVMILDSEPARVESLEAYEHPAKGAQFVKYVVAMHGARPFIVRVWTPSQGGIDDATELLAGFSFVEGVSGSAAPADPAVADAPENWFVSPDGTFAIRLPAGWHLTRGSDPTALYVSSPTAMLSISIRGAGADGLIRPCDVAGAAWESCADARPETLDELEQAIRLDRDSPELIIGPNVTDVTLAGVPATSISTFGQGGRGVLGIRYVVAMLEGRAFVVRARGSGHIEPHLGLAPLLEGFEFRTPEPIPSFPSAQEVDGSFIAPDGSFAIRLPDGWELNSGPDPSALYVGNPESRVAISIRGGDAEGWISTCDEGGPSWERCERIRPVTLEELADAVHLEADWPTAYVGPNESSESFAGVSATSFTIVAQWTRTSTSIPLGVRYVVAMREGRPFIVRATQTKPPNSHLGLMPLLDRFEFR